ncbi:STM3941 family protein [Endozoicomonas lisbonensis]|uniref:Acyl-CoA synthetase (AMP-forming)/AMP-acid ligase II n=1 Tax=Endozoicomonas lisbonensis TaxID=3120522 RepID=A0ABV2SQF3_9GAMM
MSQKKVINFDKTKVVMIGLVAVSAVLLAVWVDGLIGLFCLFFCGYHVFLQARKLFAKVPALVFAEDGVSGFLVAVQGGFVPWSKVTKISVVKKQIAIHVDNPEHYLNGYTSSLILKTYGTPFVFNPQGLEVSTDEVLQVFSEYVDASYIHSPKLASA